MRLNISETKRVIRLFPIGSLQESAQGQEKKSWHSSCHWSLLHYRQDTWVKTEMVRTCPATRRWPLRQVYPRSWSVWTSESGKAEEEMDKQHHLTRPHQPEPHTSGRRGSRRRKKKNPCGWPLTWGIHSLKERERERGKCPRGSNDITLVTLQFLNCLFIESSNQN